MGRISGRMSSLGRRALTLVGLLGVEELETGVLIVGDSFPKPFMPGSSGALVIISVLPATPGLPAIGVPLDGIAAPDTAGALFFIGYIGVALNLFSRQFLQFSQPTRAIPAQIRPTIATTGFLPIGIPFTVMRASEPRTNPRAIRNDSPHPAGLSFPRTGLVGGVNTLCLVRSQGISRE